MFYILISQCDHQKRIQQKIQHQNILCTMKVTYSSANPIIQQMKKQRSYPNHFYSTNDPQRIDNGSQIETVLITPTKKNQSCKATQNPMKKKPVHQKSRINSRERSTNKSQVKQQAKHKQDLPTKRTNSIKVINKKQQLTENYLTSTKKIQQPSSQQQQILRLNEHTRQLEQKNKLLELTIRQLTLQLKQKDHLLDECQKQIYHLKKTYDFLLKLKIDEQKILAQNHKENLHSRQAQNQGNNLAGQKFSIIQSKVEEKYDQYLSNQNQNYQRIQYSDYTLSQQSLINKQKSQENIVQGSSFDLSNSNTDQKPNDLQHSKKQSEAKQPLDTNKVQNQENSIIQQAKKQIISVYDHIQKLKRKVDKVSGDKDILEDRALKNIQNLQVNLKIQEKVKQTQEKYDFEKKKSSISTINSTHRLALFCQKRQLVEEYKG